MARIPRLGQWREAVCSTVTIAVAVCASGNNAAAAIAADIQYRVNDEMNRQLGALEDDAERIDQERHVVRYGQDERVR